MNNTSQRVNRAFDAVPRERFLPEEQRGFAHVDAPLRLSHGQTNSQPTTVSNMLNLLDVPEGARVLDVGAGSGWTTALLAELVGETGTVLGVEIVPELVEGARSAIDGWPNASIQLAEHGQLGLPQEAPFDRILVSAEAKTDVPRPLVEQLAPGGLMVIPVRGTMLRVERQSPSEQPIVTKHGSYAFVPLLE